ncbi:hypothetical protein BFK02_001489 [Salmonella enterica subsp. enterica serovar Java]|nr:hypothetical protein [Salmonella enterica subsp. enterica serovar Java]
MTKLERYMQRVMADTGNPNLLSEIQDACRKKQAFCFGAPDGQLVLKPMVKDNCKYPA